MTIFSKRHYEAVAKVMQAGNGRASPDNFAQMFAADNSAFNYTRFLAACKPGANVKAKKHHSNGVVCDA